MTLNHDVKISWTSSFPIPECRLGSAPRFIAFRDSELGAAFLSEACLGWEIRFQVVGGSHISGLLYCGLISSKGTQLSTPVVVVRLVPDSGQRLSVENLLGIASVFVSLQRSLLTMLGAKCTASINLRKHTFRILLFVLRLPWAFAFYFQPIV